MDLEYLWLIVVSRDPQEISALLMVIFTGTLLLNQWLQNRFNRRAEREKYKILLLEQRIRVYSGIRDFLSEFSRHGKPSFEEAAKLRRDTHEAMFLFPPQAKAFLDELFQKSLAHKIATDRWEPLRERAWRGEELTGAEKAEKKAALEKRHEIEEWFRSLAEKGDLNARLGGVFDIDHHL